MTIIVLLSVCNKKPVDQSSIQVDDYGLMSVEVTVVGIDSIFASGNYLIIWGIF